MDPLIKLCELTNSAFEKGQFDRARQLAEKILEQQPHHLFAIQILGEVAFERSNWPRAIRFFNFLVEQQHDSPPFLWKLAHAYKENGQSQEATNLFTQILAKEPDHLPTIRDHIGLMEHQGKYEEAMAFLEQVRADGVSSPYFNQLEALLHLRMKRYEEVVQLVTPLIDQEKDRPLRASLAYTLGKAYDQLNEPELAIKAWHTANRCTPAKFSKAAYKRSVDHILKYFTKERMRKLARANNPTEAPIFITGMPRSGTTLTEQILSSHPDAHGIGEAADFLRMAARLKPLLNLSQEFPYCLEECSAEQLSRPAEGYLLLHEEKLGYRPKKLINKSLATPTHIGLISLLYPKAKILHCLRNPLGCGLSIYMGQFGNDQIPYHTDLENIGFAWGQNQRLMDHWAELSELPIEVVQYEETVTNQEQRTRQILDFVGLPFNEACLRFYKRKNYVKTMSYSQVTQPIYRSSIDRHKRYEKYLEPFLKGLETAKE